MPSQVAIDRREPVFDDGRFSQSGMGWDGMNKSGTSSQLLQAKRALFRGGMKVLNQF